MQKKGDSLYQMLLRMWRKWNSHTLLVGIQNGTPLWKRAWQFLKKLNMYLTVWTASPKYLLKRKESLCPYKDLYPTIYSGGIHNHPQLATIQTPINRRTDTHVIRHPDNKTLLSNKREQMTARRNRNDSQNIMLSDIKATNCTVPFMWHSGKDNTPRRAKGWVLPEEIYYKGTGGHFWGWQGCPITRLWWWLHHGTHLSKLFQWQT